MKKIIAITVSFFVVITGLYFFTNVFNWLGLKGNEDTFEVYINKTKIGNDKYSKDSLAMSVQLKRFLLTQDDLPYSKQNSQRTKIIIDTIAYSPDLNKLAVLVITKNPATGTTGSSKEENVYYNATRFLGVRRKDSISLSWLGPTFINAEDKQELSKAIREACFRNSVRKDTTGLYSYKYNLNDTRFWTSSLWREKEEEKRRRKQFEELKVRRPENLEAVSK